MTVLEVFSLVSQSLSHILSNNIVSVFLRDLKLKFCLKNSIPGPFFDQTVGPQVGSKMVKKAIFIQATKKPSLPNQFLLKLIKNLINIRPR